MAIELMAIDAVVVVVDAEFVVFAAAAVIVVDVVVAVEASLTFGAVV